MNYKHPKLDEYLESDELPEQLVDDVITGMCENSLDAQKLIELVAKSPKLTAAIMFSMAEVCASIRAEYLKELSDKVNESLHDNDLEVAIR